MRRYQKAREVAHNPYADPAANIVRLSDADLAAAFLTFDDSNGVYPLLQRERVALQSVMVEMTTRFGRLVEENETLLAELEVFYAAESGGEDCV